jgi:hypothetical protein
MKYLHDLKDMLCEELEEYAGKGELSAGSLDVIHKLTDTVKNIDKILMLEEYGEEDESHEGGSYASHRVGGGNSYRNGGNEGRRVGGSNTRGEYNGNSYKRDRYGRYSRDDGKDRMMVMIDELMGMASDENQRTAIRRMKEELERI